MLAERKAAILGALVEGHIATGAPVSSRAILDRSDLDLSSATIRNEMVVLERLPPPPPPRDGGPVERDPPLPGGGARPGSPRTRGARRPSPRRRTGRHRARVGNRDRPRPPVPGAATGTGQPRRGRRGRRGARYPRRSWAGCRSPLAP